MVFIYLSAQLIRFAIYGSSNWWWWNSTLVVIDAAFIAHRLVDYARSHGLNIDSPPDLPLRDLILLRTLVYIRPRIFLPFIDIPP